MRYAVVLALLAAPLAAHAQRESPVTGNKLLALCTTAATANCDAYLSGVADAIAAQGREHAMACIPNAVSGSQLREVMLRFLHAHPEQLQLKAATLSTKAFSSSFPCSK